MVFVVMDLVTAELDRLHARIAPRFGRSEPRTRVREYVSGLVAGVDRKNGWTLAEQAGEAGPDGMQRLLRRADWDVDGSATTSAITWSSSSATLQVCWSWTRPGS